jgi:hypothetical protein
MRSQTEIELSYGEIGESLIANWLKHKGFDVLPVYEKIIDTGKGPQLFTAYGNFVAPDLLVFNHQKVLWIEAKHKTAFTWHRITSTWVTGIDLHHYHDYWVVYKRSPWPVFLLFLHEGGQAKDSPPDSPAGLFGERLEYLRQHEHHRHGNWGKTGMVYWSVDVLKRYASINEFYQCATS